MRPTCALYVDAGYLLASAASRVTGTSLRSGIHVDYRAIVDSLVRTAEERSGLPVLRVHWYDSARNGVPDHQQERIGELPKVKLRLGRFGVDGQQKGVDLRIGLDLVAHARNNASDVFFLVSGDDDLTEAVEEAQVLGVQVVVLAVPTRVGKPHAVARHLIRAADELDLVDGDDVDAAVLKVEVPRPMPVPDPAAVAAMANARQAAPETKPSAAPSPLTVAAVAGRPQPGPAEPVAVLAYTGSTGEGSTVLPGYEEVDDALVREVVDRVLESFRKSATAEEWRALENAKPSIPREIDRALLLDASDAIGMYDLHEQARYRLRARFWERHAEM
jgi:uncharacterized LabA/DUF88 family protein